MFKNRKLLIVTKHKKESVIAPILEKELGVTCYTDEHFDTDQYGTFSGEIERLNDPITTLKNKCLSAMEQNDCDLAIASEGSFGPHPTLFFVNADDEFLIFIDKQNQIEIIVRELSTSTNFSGKEINSKAELLDFAQNIGFPSHGLIIKNNKKQGQIIEKGIVDSIRLNEVYQQFKTDNQPIYVETDMRAMFNPTRMEVIKTATSKLVSKIKSCCPKCEMPGFDVCKANKGLACNLCGFPTNSILSYIYECQHCKFTKTEMYPHNKQFEDPMYCDHCNP
jgi:hypothetical protein